MPISGLVITYNESKFIGACIDGLFKVCDEVIVVDSFSTDDTCNIAASKGAKVLSQKFLGDGPQRIFGVTYCKNDWILNLDADEFLDTDSIDFIRSGGYVQDLYDAFSFRVKNYLGDKLINFAGWYPDRKIRFFNKRSASPSTDMVHQKVQYRNLKKINTHILHYGWSSLSQLIAKKNLYAEWNAKQMFDRGRKVTVFRPLINGTFNFCKSYFFEKGIFHGLDGITLSITQAYFSYLKYANLLKLQKQSKRNIK